MFIDHLSIIGVGLIGGSLARALRKAGCVNRVTGCNQSVDTLKKARALAVIDDYTLAVNEAVADADVVVMATPLITTEKLLPQIVESLKPGAILTDVGSAKGSVVSVARGVMGDKFPFFIPGHPIAGTEQSGVEASFATLFIDHRVILTPLSDTNLEALKLITEMWQAVGADVINLDVEHHDEMLAATSHLPHLLAYTLVDCLADMQAREEIFKYTAGGFADFTRIAASSPEMWHDICFSNRLAILNALKNFACHINKITHTIENSDSETLLAFFQRAKNARDKLTPRT